MDSSFWLIWLHDVCKRAAEKQAFELEFLHTKFSTEIFWPILSKPNTTQSAQRHVLRHVFLFFSAERERIPMENILNTKRMTTRTHQYADFNGRWDGLSTVPIAKWLCMLSKKKKSLFILKSIRFSLVFSKPTLDFLIYWCLSNETFPNGIRVQLFTRKIHVKRMKIIETNERKEK